MEPCNHRREDTWELIDARGIYCCRVCERCEAEKMKEYRLDIFTDPDYWHDEPIDE